MNEISRTELEKLQSGQTPPGGENAHRARILVVDDEKLNRTIISHELTEHGFLVEVAENGPSALERIAHKEYDLIILDIVMEGMDGFEVLARIREEHTPGALPVIMATSSDSSENIARALEGQANDYVTKPLQMPVALARIHTQLDRKFANDAVRRSEERLALAISGSNDGIWDWDLVNETLYLSERWCEIIGVRSADQNVAPDFWLDRIHVEDRQDVMRNLRASLDGIAHHFASEHRVRHENGTYRWVLVRGMTARSRDGEPIRIAGSMTDITGHKAVDRLTGLPNRAPLAERVDRTLSRIRHDPEHLAALLAINIDGLGLINEGYGEKFGDTVLKAVANRLTNTLRPTDVVASLGGDEFSVFLDRIEEPANALEVGRRIQNVIGETINSEERSITLTSGVGIVVSDDRHKTGNDMISEALTALSRAKKMGKGGIATFDEQMLTASTRRLDMEQGLRAAIDDGHISLAYQPILDLATGAIIGFEALARWDDPHRGMVSPGDFIPVAEESGLIGPLTEQVLRQASSTAADWYANFAKGRDFFISVNLSARNFETRDLVSYAQNLLTEYRIPPSMLKVEVTESQMMKDIDGARRMLEEFREVGISIALDDFGTGHSSLEYLARLPLDTLKIDRSFIDKSDEMEEKRKILHAIVALGKSLDMMIVGEGVETAGEHGVVCDLGCDAVQGFLYAKPMPAADLTGVLEKWKIATDCASAA